MKAMKRVSSSNAIKSMRKVSSGNALKEMAEVATSLREITNTNVAKLKEKKQKIDVKGIMTRVGMKKVAKHRKAKDTDGSSFGSQQSPISVIEVETGEDVEYENVTLYDIQVLDDAALAVKGFDPLVTNSIQKESEQVEEKAEAKHIEEKEAQEMESAPAQESARVQEYAPETESAPKTESAPAKESAPVKEDAPATESAPEDAPATENAPAQEIESAPESVPVLEKEGTIVAPTIPAEHLVQVVLLLTDATTRRFELIQLDFDSSRARVHDILTEIPIAATEEFLRVKKYVAICSKMGDMMDNSKLVTEYFRSDDNGTFSNFALAVPEGMTGKECAHVASPILSDSKILSMASIAVEEESSHVEKKTDDDSSIEPKDPSSTESSENQKVAEGDEHKPEKDPNISTLKEIETERDTPTPAPVSPSSTDAGSAAAEEVVDAESDTITKTETTTKQIKSNAKSALISAFAMFFIAAFSVSVKYYNDYISFPLGPGDILHAGGKRHKCGLLRFLPEKHTGCHSLTLENDGSGILGLYDGEEILWQMYAPTCDEGCAVTLNDDGKVLIGDREGFFSSRAPANVSPWPFSQNVKNSFKKKKL